MEIVKRLITTILFLLVCCQSSPKNLRQCLELASKNQSDPKIESKAMNCYSQFQFTDPGEGMPYGKFYYKNMFISCTPLRIELNGQIDKAICHNEARIEEAQDGNYNLICGEDILQVIRSKNGLQMVDGQDPKSDKSFALYNKESSCMQSMTPEEKKQHWRRAMPEGTFFLKTGLATCTSLEVDDRGQVKGFPCNTSSRLFFENNSWYIECGTNRWPIDRSEKGFSIVWPENGKYIDHLFFTSSSSCGASITVEEKEAAEKIKQDEQAIQILEATARISRECCLCLQRLSVYRFRFQVKPINFSVCAADPKKFIKRFGLSDMGLTSCSNECQFFQ